MAFVMSEYEVNNTKFANASKSICFIQVSLLFTLIPLLNDLFNRKTGTKARLYFVKLPLSNCQCSGNYCLIKYSVKYTFQVTLTFRLTTANRKKTQFLLFWGSRAISSLHRLSCNYLVWLLGQQQKQSIDEQKYSFNLPCV